MKIYEILSLCNDMAKLGLPAEYFTADNQSALADERIRAMLTCCATVSEELYCDYAAAVKKCRVRAENGFIDCSKLRLCRVISLTDSMGNAAKYRYTEGGADNGRGGVHRGLCGAAPKDGVGRRDKAYSPHNSPHFRLRHNCRILLYFGGRSGAEVVGAALL